MSEPLIVTLDGPAGVGKTTLARRLADSLGIAYMDTGAMFRTLALRLGPDAPELSEEEIRRRAAGLVFALRGSGSATSLLCDGVPVGMEIRTEEVGQMASRLAAVPAVREILKDVQRRMGSETSLVAEGRDMGTVIFPGAGCKFFLDASPRVRALRRLGDLKAMGKSVALEELEAQIRERDERDRNRAVAPLRPADDAWRIDTSDLGLEEVLALLLERAGSGATRDAGGEKFRRPPHVFLSAARAARPLVHFITNVVTMNDCANMTLAAGGSPVMADAPEEADQVTAICQALVLNTGTLSQDTGLAMLRAGRAAREAGHMVVLDPVGAGIADLRNALLRRILKEVSPDVIKGNISEIRWLAEGRGGARGVDAAGADLTGKENLREHADLARSLAARQECVVVITGPVDIVADGTRAFAVENGSPWLERVSGTGCMAAAVLGVFAGASPEEPLMASCAAMAAMGLAGETAAARLGPGQGTGSFRTFLLDAMSTLDESALDTRGRVRRVP